MYVTRRLSMYKKDPSALSLPPPDGPNSGILVIQDVENQITQSRGCLSTDERSSYDITTGLPFPQNTSLTCRRTSTWKSLDFMAVPVLDKPLSSGLYYLMHFGEWKGFAFTCAKKVRRTRSMCCFCCNCDFDDSADAYPDPLHPSNIYQQFRITRGRRYFEVMSSASDGKVPESLQRIDILYSHYPCCLWLADDALGLDHSLRERLPEFDFSLSRESSDAVVVGKWYCPFAFVKQKDFFCSDQMRRSMFYGMTLKQQWIRVFSCNRDDVRGDSVSVDVNVKTQVIDVVGMARDHCDNNVKVKEDGDGITWFHGLDREGQIVSVGLNRVITEKINKDQESFGWVRDKDKIKVVENFEGHPWKKFGCYMLVEKYVLKTKTKKLVLIIEFWHTHKLRYKWE